MVLRINLFDGFVNGFFEIFFVGRLGVEPRTNALKGRCSTFELPSQKPEFTGLEPATSAVTGQRSNQLS